MAYGVLVAVLGVYLLGGAGESSAAAEPLRACVASAPAAHGSHPFQVAVRFSTLVEAPWPAGSYSVSTGELIAARPSAADPLVWLVRLAPAWSADITFRLWPAESGGCTESRICAVSGRPLSHLLTVHLPARPWYHNRLVQPPCR